MAEQTASELARLLNARLVHEMRTAKSGPRFRQIQEILSGAQRLATVIEDLVKTVDKLHE